MNLTTLLPIASILLLVEQTTAKKHLRVGTKRELQMSMPEGITESLGGLLDLNVPLDPASQAELVNKLASGKVGEFLSSQAGASIIFTAISCGLDMADFAAGGMVSDETTACIAAAALGGLPLPGLPAEAVEGAMSMP